jgi:pro-apoptotic serine protease NMA111
MIVDAEKGLGVASRSVVPFDLGVLTLTFAENVIVPGKVLTYLWSETF